MKTAETDTFFDVRAVAWEGGDNTPINVKGCSLLKLESAIKSAWYLKKINKNKCMHALHKCNIYFPVLMSKISGT